MSAGKHNPTIERATYLEDLVRDHPNLVVPLEEQGVICMRCGMVSWDTLEEAARKAGVEDVDALVIKLRDLAGNSTPDIR